ncbi:MAG: TAXI family TRAP transporter solute-binding subunit [Thermodesulfobacteriota bacterium]
MFRSRFPEIPHRQRKGITLCRHLALCMSMAALILAGAWTLPGAAQAAPPKALSFSGGSPGGNYNLLTTALSPLLVQGPSKISVFPEGSTGSPENIRRTQSGETDMALGFASDLVEAWNGEGRFKSPHKKIRALAYMDANIAHVVTLAKSNITSFEQLYDKKLALGPQGSGSSMNIERLLRQLGAWDRVRSKAVYQGAMDASQALKDGHIDAYNWHVNIGNATYHDTASTYDIRIIDLDTPARASGFYKKYPFYTPFTIPGGIYRSVNAPVKTFATPTFWIVNESFPEDRVFELLSVAFSDGVIRRMHDAVGLTAQKNYGKDKALQGVPIPLHPGAIKYWKSQGFTVPDVR